jgi:hypothetical protein
MDEELLNDALFSLRDGAGMSKWTGENNGK